MSIKSLLHATIKAGSTFAYPKGKSITVGTISAHSTEAEGWKDQLVYIPPCDGIIRVTTSKANVYIEGSSTGAIVQMHNEPITYNTWCPVCRGDRIYVTVFVCSVTSTVSFYPASGQA